MGANGSAVGQDREGLLHQKQNVRHLEDTGHLRLHQIRSAAQPAHAAVRPGGGAIHVCQVLGRYRNTAGQYTSLLPPFSRV